MTGKGSYRFNEGTERKTFLSTYFLLQGKFLQCKSELGSIIHLYHRQCQVFRDNKYHCPHCGQESAQTEVTLKLNEPRKATMFVKEFKEPDKPSLG